MGRGASRSPNLPDARARKRDAVRILLQYPGRLQSEGLAALRLMRRAAAEPTFSPEERGEYQDLVDGLEKARTADWREKRRSGRVTAGSHAGARASALRLIGREEAAAALPGPSPEGLARLRGVEKAPAE